jgi:putative ABC transport system permease protein
MPDWKKYVREHLHLSGLHRDRETEIIEEVAQQMEEVYQESLRGGQSQEEARLAAVNHIPDWNVFAATLADSQKKQRTHLEARAAERLERTTSGKCASIFTQFLKDLLFGIRSLRKSPRFTIAAILTIALGIGATTAIFSLLNGVILQPLPYPRGEQIVWVWGKFSQGEHAAISPPDFLDYRSRSRSFESLGAMDVAHQWINITVNRLGKGEPQRMNASYVTSGFFEAFGIQPVLGRTFQDREEKEGAAPSVILSFDAWKNYFGGDSHIVGKAVLFNRKSCNVIGVMARGFYYPVETDVWLPIVFAKEDMHRQYHFLRPIGRLKEGATIEQAQAELNTISRQLELAYPESNSTWKTRLESFRQHVVGDMRRPLLVIFSAVCFVLMIACANVANLLLARTTARRREIAIRLALGADRGHLFRQLLAESLLVSIPAGVIGFVAAYWSIHAFKMAAPDFVPRLNEVSVNGWTFLFMTTVSLLTAFLVSLAPLLETWSSTATESLTERTTSGTGGGRGRLRPILAVSEIALSLVLLAGAALLLKSFWQMTKIDPGFRADNVSMMRVLLDDERYKTNGAKVSFVEAVLDKVRSLPGVESATAGNGLPLIAAGGDRFFTIEGRPVPANDADKPNAQFRTITRDYFKTLSIPLLRGRDFTSQDDESSPGVVVINDALAQTFFKTEDPIGQYLQVENEPKPFRAQIIGIVRSSRQILVEPPMPEMYFPFRQLPMGFFILAVRSRAGLSGQMQAVRSSIQQLDPALPLRDFRSMGEILATGYARNRLNALLLAAAALLALLLAAIGIYGVLSFSVEQRRHEIGIRMALGAERSDIQRMILRYGAGLAAIGLCAGLFGAVLVARWLRALLFEVSPLDPISLALASAILLMVAILACWLPALRATRLDPLAILRYE